MEEENKKLGFGSGLAIGIIMTVLVICLLLMFGAITLLKRYPQLGLFPNKPQTEAGPANTEFDVKRISKKLESVQNLISDQFLYEQDAAACEKGMFDGYFAALNDPYAGYYDQEAFKQLTEDTEGNYCGIGCMIQQNTETGELSVVRVFDDSPAQEAGVKSGDIIYKVGETLYSDVEFEVLVNDYIKGPEGTTVTILFLRDGQEVTLEVARRPIETPTVEFEMREGDIGFIEITQFMVPTEDQFKKAIDTLEAQGAKGLIFDLRDNPGGVLNTAIGMAEYVLPDGLITYTADKNGNGEKYYGNDGHQVDLPIVILVNENSASASEVFTGALMDYSWGTVVGTNTYGKGIVQEVIGLDDGSAIKFTSHHYYTPNGTDLHGEGLKPDVEVKLPDACKEYGDENDEPFKKAIELLKK